MKWIYIPGFLGTVKLIALPKRQKGAPAPGRSTVLMSSTHASQALNAGTYDMTSSWFVCRQVISTALDECSCGSWVFVKSPITVRLIEHQDVSRKLIYIHLKSELITGRIDAILQNDSGNAVIILDVFQVADSRHEIFGMPVLARRHSETSFIIIPTAVSIFYEAMKTVKLTDGSGQDIKFLYNVQHDCNLAECEATGEKPRMQERVDSGLTDKFIVHKPVERFIINTHAFHNAHLLRQVLPRTLTKPIPLFADRKSKHYELAGNLREIKNGKRKRAAEKREEKKQAKETQKKAPRSVDGQNTSSDDDSEEESRPKKKPRRQRIRKQVEDEDDSDSEYDGNAGVGAGPPRASARTRRPTQKARDGDYGWDSE